MTPVNMYRCNPPWQLCVCELIGMVASRDQKVDLQGDKKHFRTFGTSNLYNMYTLPETDIAPENAWLEH